MRQLLFEFTIAWALTLLCINPFWKAQEAHALPSYDLPTEIYHGPEPHDCRRWAYTDAFGVCVWLGNLDERPAWSR